MVLFKTLENSVKKLEDWISRTKLYGWDPFDGLKSPLAKYLTFDNKYLRIIWQQFFKRFPINFRLIAGIKKGIISKTISDLMSAYIILYNLYKDKKYIDKVVVSLEWLEENSYKVYSGHSWGVGFDYQSRGIYAKRGVPNIVTTYYNANAFLDTYELLGNLEYLKIAKSSCNFILKDIGFTENNDTLCISYYPTQKDQIHNANMFGAALLSRVYKYTGEKYLLETANNAVKYTIKYQRTNGSWFYGEEPMYRWIDNFHTGYVLESLYNYIDYTGDSEFMPSLLKGIEFYKNNLFLPDGTPKYYHNKTYPIDIQCAAQAIQTFAILSNVERKLLDMAIKIARWTIENMQDESGYFYYRKYRFFVNKIPYMRWGESTILVALAHLMKTINSTNGGIE